MDNTNETITGNGAKMREALEFANKELCKATEDDRFGDDLVYLVGCMRTVAEVCRVALAAPPRNCDVGTPKELSKRMAKFCGEQYKKKNGVSLCSGCRFYDIGGLDCQFAWSQMPYEEGENK